MKRGQSSVEYLFIVALSMMLIIPASMLFFTYSKSSEDSVIGSQINRVGLELLIKVEEMYIVGNNSWVTVEVSLPDSLQNVTIYGGGASSEIVFSYYTQSGLTDAVFFSDIIIANGTGCWDAAGGCSVDFVPGINNIRVTSWGDRVSIDRS